MSEELISCTLLALTGQAAAPVARALVVPCLPNAFSAVWKPHQPAKDAGSGPHAEVRLEGSLERSWAARMR